MDKKIPSPTLAWQKLPPSSDLKRIHCSITPYKEYIIIIGGIMAQSSLFSTCYADSNDVILFDPANNKVHKVQVTGTTPQVRHGHTACVYKNKLVIFGGDDEKGGGASFGATPPMTPTDEVATMSLDTIELLSAEWKIVKTGDRRDFARCYHTAHIDENDMYVYGGEVGPTRKLSNKVVKFNLNTSSWKWCQVTGSVPGPSKDQFSVWIQKKMYACERKITNCYNELYVFELATFNWKRIEFKQSERFVVLSMMQNVGSDIYILGNIQSNRSSVKNFVVYNTESDIWQSGEVKGDGPLDKLPLKVICHQNQFIVLENEKDINMYSLTIDPTSGSSGRSNQRDQEYIKEMRGLLFDKTYSDITFIVQDQQLTAHKNILSARCKFFSNMFTSGMAESQASKLEIFDVQLPAFKALLEFIYCNEVKLNQNLALELLEACDKYSFSELKKVCESFLVLQLSLENYVQLANASEKYGADGLREKVMEFVIKNKGEIQKKEMAGKLSTELLWEIIFKMNNK